MKDCAHLNSKSHCMREDYPYEEMLGKPKACIWECPGISKETHLAFKEEEERVKKNDFIRKITYLNEGLQGPPEFETI